MIDLHFLRPNLLLLFIPFLLLVILLMRKNRSTNFWSHICSKDLMPYVLTEKAAKSNVILYSLTLLALSLLIIGFAGPAWQTLPQPLIKPQSGVVIILDLSPSMDAEDIKPSRLKRAIYKINDLLNMRKEGQTALIVFSGDPFVVTPLTDDVETIRALLPVLDTTLMPSAGHRVSAAINKATELFTQAGQSSGSILLVTSALSANEMEKAAESATKAGSSISILGIGTDENAPIPKQNGGFVRDDKGALVITTLAKENLSRLAKLTHGTYVTISVDDSDIQALVDRLSDFHQQHSQEEIVIKQTKWHDQGYLFVILALPLFSLMFRRGILLMVCFMLPQALHASSWDTIFKTPDQQAEAFFHQENYQEAKELFQNRNWQGAANYRLGDYESAIEAFQEDQTPDGFYNYGTAKAKQGDFEGALKAYQAVLEKDPDHEDAKYNKKLIEEWQQQQKQNQEQNPPQNQENNQSGDQQQQDQNQQQQQSDQQQNQDKQGQRDQQQKGDEQPNQQNKQDKQEKKEQGNKSEQKQQKSPEQQEKESAESENTEGKQDQAPNKDLQDHYRDQVDKELEQEKQPQAEKPVAQQEVSPEDEQRQIDDRWLQRIPDDPGALLRRKFMYQYKNQNKS